MGTVETVRKAETADVTEAAAQPPAGKHGEGNQCRNLRKWEVASAHVT